MLNAWLTDRRSFLKGLGSLPLAASAGGFKAALAQSKDPVTFLLDWTWWPPQIPLLVAQEKGYFSSAGLDVELRQGNGSGNTCQVVGQKTYDLGHANLTTAAQMIAKGVPIKSVATISNRGASGFAFKKGRVADVKGLIGKRIGSTAGGSDAQIMPAFFKRAGISLSDVTIVNLPGDAKLGALLTDQIDVISGDSYYYIALAADKGVELEQLVFGDYGANTIGYGLISNEEFMAAHPDRITRFVAAALQGYSYAEANLDEAIDIYMKISETGQDTSTVRNILTGYLRLIKSGATEANPFNGKNDPAVWAGTLEILKQYGGLTSDKDPADYWTNQFVPL